MVWSAVDNEGNIAVGLRKFQAASWDALSVSRGLLNLGDNRNLILDAANLLVTEMPGDPGVTGVIHPIGVE
jgi:hypothetical protein